MSQTTKVCNDISD